jgi:pimeloyl-ACP methyl ester carboxylesterase
VENKAANVKLSGTLTLPRGEGPHPAAVFITGSGPQDRDESLMGHRPFLVLADHLTRQGIAVLRYDDRGVAQSTGNFGEALHTDFVEDALAAVAFLKTHKGIDAKRTGLVGHSEGGVIAPLAAVKQPGDIAFVVMLAGVGVPMQELMIRQCSDVARLLGTPEDVVVKVAASQRELYPRLIQAADTAAAEKLMREMMEKQMAEYSPEQRAALNMTEGMMAGQVKMAASPWFRKLIAYDPKPTLREMKCPVLAVNGEKDVQVAAKENLAGIREALAAGGNNRVKTIEFPGAQSSLPNLHHWRGERVRENRGDVCASRIASGLGLDPNSGGIVTRLSSEWRL